MRTPVKWGLCAVALLAAFGMGRGDRVYTETDLARAREDAYNSGYHVGYSEGLTAEQVLLYEEAFAAGRSEGYSSGLADASQNAQSVIVPEQTYQVASITSIPPSSEDSSDTPSSTQLPAEDQEQITVYITNSGAKYHLDGCRHLRSKVKTTLAAAKERKLEPCKVCNPPN